MSSDFCYGIVCFVRLDANAPKFFGFSEYLAGLALMVLAWTIADIRYHFRIKTTPLPLQGITFFVVSGVGVLTLLTDLWRAEQWFVPRGHLLTPSGWQALLGGALLVTFLTWAWFAFIRPPVFGKRNAKRYAQALYMTILKGAPSESSVIADEFANSAKSLIHYATDRGRFKYHHSNEETDVQPPESLPKATAYANDILLLVADKRFCRVIVESSPGTALALFNEIGKAKKYGIQIEVFAKNIMNAALNNKDSFLFHEAKGYESGLIGYLRPLSQAMFCNHRMVEVIGTVLDPNVREKQKWDAAQWEAYCGAVLMTIRDYVENGFMQHSPVLFRAISHIEHAADDLYKIDGVVISVWDNDAQERLNVIIDFVKDVIEILEKKGLPTRLQLRVRDKNGVGNFYDQVANMIFEVIFSASAVRSPSSQCWWIQHNAVWSKLFNFNMLNGPAAIAVKFKVRRLIYNEISEMIDFPNFKGAKVLGFCLNVMGLSVKKQEYFQDSKALQKAVLLWTKNNYAWLHTYNPRVAEACLVDGMSYDEENLRLVKTHPIQGLQRKPHHVYFEVNPPNQA